jgi:hypothetical protein
MSFYCWRFDGNCKYRDVDEGCLFYYMGSGVEEDMPCYNYTEDDEDEKEEERIMTYLQFLETVGTVCEMKNKLGLLSIAEAIIKYLYDLGYSNKRIHYFLSNAEIEIDSGWECSETGFKSVWINLEKNKICLVNDHEERYSQEYEWDDYKGWVKVLEG